MASLSIFGDNSSYSLTLSGMDTSKRYHVFIADLKPDGNASGYYCRRSSKGSSSSWTYSGSSSSTYSVYKRLVQVYQTDSATPFNVGSKYTSGEITSGLSGTGWSAVASEYIPAASSPYKVNIVLGTGVSGGKYIKNSTSGTRVTFRGDLTVDVGAGGYVYLTEIYYDTDYTYPVTASVSGGGSWTVINSSGEWSDNKVSASSSSGTRVVTLTATWDGYYYYRVHYFHNDGTGDSGYKPSSSGYYQIKSTSTNFNLNLLPSLTRDGYTLKGWSYTSSGKAYTGTIELIATSTASSSPTIKNLYAIWQKAEIDLFTWTGSDSGDNAAFARGQSISSALTATRWNAMLAKIKEVAEANGGSFSYSEVSGGDRITASTFNAARTGISNLTGHGTLPSVQRGGSSKIFASLFVGSSSLKSALNAAIKYYNKS